MIRRLTTVSVVATILAGWVGVFRQRAEAQAIRRGELAPASAATEIPLRARYGPLARRLSTWVPAPPRTRWGRTLGAVWASPMTALGLLLALVGGRRPRWDAARACWIGRGVRGPSAFALRAVGADANAIGQVVLSPGSDPAAVLLAHETVHVRQAERLGPAMIVLYVWLGARYGYRDHPLERAARTGARRTL